MPATILITGGAGFVGSNLALCLKRDSADVRVIAFDNLHRRGSELTLPRLRAAGVEFVHGDIRNPEDLAQAGAFDTLLECSAEPSVHAGYDGSPAYLINTNLVGTAHCLEAARQHGADLLFLSTSRVYPIAGMRDLPLQVEGTRLEIPAGQSGPGWSVEGIAEGFALAGSRSMYGATKLASELLIEEYRAMYGMRAVINRCGVLTGPWQMGKVDQGFMVLWAARHLYGGKLGYMGFGGHGHQVRDVLHVEDLYDLVRIQLGALDQHDGAVYNVGGGRRISTSLLELTERCRAHCAEVPPIEIGRDPETRAADVPYYVSDSRLVIERSGWNPTRDLDRILDDIYRWLRENRSILEPLLSA